MQQFATRRVPEAAAAAVTVAELVCPYRLIERACPPLRQRAPAGLLELTAPQAGSSPLVAMPRAV